MPRSIALLLAGWLALVSAPAFAQPSQPNRNYNDHDAISVAENVGYCLAFQTPALAYYRLRAALQAANSAPAPAASHAH